MTLTLDQPSGYALVSFLPETALPESLSQSLPDEMAQDDLVIRKLGVKAWGRLDYFRRFYSQAWGDRGTGGPLSPRAVQGLRRFLEACGDCLSSLQRKPSLFLTDDGLLELCWEDLSGKAIQLVFRPTEVEYFIEQRHVEGCAAYQPDSLRKLAAILSI